MINGNVLDIICKNTFAFSDIAGLQNAHSCKATISHIVTGKYDRKMENIVCVRPFQRHSFHIRSEKTPL